MNKKAIAMEMIAWIIFISVCFILIVGLIYQAFSKAQGKSAEIICRASVALREKSTVSTEDVTGVSAVSIEAKLTPLLCKAIDKKVPVKGDTKEDSLKEFSDLIATCWWQFLEGTSKNTFGQGGLGDIFWSGSSDKCFICYPASVQVPFSREELRDFLDSKPYIVEGGSDSCTLDGRGKCESGNSCTNGHVYDGGNCEDKQICCVTDNICEDKGGKCMDSCDSRYSTEYPLWDCGGKKCCLNPDNVITYAKYVQSNRGEGYIAIKNGISFGRDRSYAITYVAETTTIEPNVFDFGNIKKHRILVSNLDDVKDKCVVQTGTGGK